MENSIKLQRAVCCRCGSKKYLKFLESAYWSNAKILYKSSWLYYPRKNTLICKEKCLPFGTE